MKGFNAGSQLKGRDMDHLRFKIHNFIEACAKQVKDQIEGTFKELEDELNGEIPCRDNDEEVSFWIENQSKIDSKQPAQVDESREIGSIHIELTKVPGDKDLFEDMAPDNQLTRELNYTYDQKAFLLRAFSNYVDESLPSDFDLEQSKFGMPEVEEREYSQKSGYCNLIQAVGNLFPDLIERFEGFLCGTPGPMDLQWAKEEILGLNRLCNEILIAVIKSSNDLFLGIQKGKPENLFRSVFGGLITDFFNSKVWRLTEGESKSQSAMAQD